MPAGTQHLPREARAALDEYLTALDAVLPRIARGIYLTGSAALGDWQRGRSDVDIVTVTERPLAGYTARLLPGYGALLARAREHRLGGGAAFTVADGYAACDLVDAVADDAAGLG
jgi:predicted nucleotidyltransferase